MTIADLEVAPSAEAVLTEIAGIVGEAQVMEPGGEAALPFTRERRGRLTSKPLAVIRPGSTEEMARVVAACAAAGLAMVPQGGNTGLVGGTIVEEGRQAVILSTDRLTAVREIDPANDTITVEAGCILQAVQQLAEAQDRLFPLSLGAEGSCRIGGNLSTNAGGILTVGYGNARDLVLGLEVVLPDGRIWNGLTGLRKDNTGYDLKQLFIAGEGTLGIITAATLKLFPRPARRETAFLAVRDPAAALTLFGALRRATGDSVIAFELIPGNQFALASEQVPETVRPLATEAPWYVLSEMTAGSEAVPLRAVIEAALAGLMEQGLVLDGTFAESEDRRKALWFIREAIVEAVRRKRAGSIHHDCSVPVSRTPDFINRTIAETQAAAPGSICYCFGHLGDGNIHVTVMQPPEVDKHAFLDRYEEINRLVHRIALDLGGSISAEHGIGLVKRAELAETADPVGLELMRRIKQAFDPEGLMNPGKILA